MVLESLQQRTAPQDGKVELQHSTTRPQALAQALAPGVSLGGALVVPPRHWALVPGPTKAQQGLVVPWLMEIHQGSCSCSCHVCVCCVNQHYVAEDFERVRDHSRPILLRAHEVAILKLLFVCRRQLLGSEGAAEWRGLLGERCRDRDWRN